MRKIVSTFTALQLLFGFVSFLSKKEVASYLNSILAYEIALGQEIGDKKDNKGFYADRDLSIEVEGEGSQLVISFQSHPDQSGPGYTEVDSNFNMYKLLFSAYCKTIFVPPERLSFYS